MRFKDITNKKDEERFKGQIKKRENKFKERRNRKNKKVKFAQLIRDGVYDVSEM